MEGGEAWASEPYLYFLFLVAAEFQVTECTGRLSGIKSCVATLSNVALR